MNAVLSPLDFFHHPASVAIVGASDDPDKIGGRPLQYMLKFGFSGALYPINLSRRIVQGIPAYMSLSDLPEVPDVAIIAVSGRRAVDAVAAAAEVGVKGCVVMSSGFGETSDPESQAMQLEMVEIARESGMRIVGPNSQGLANFASGAVLGFSTMFSEQAPLDGPVAIVSQSGAMCAVPYGLLRQRGIGVRYAHGSGNDADVSVGELAEAVLDDPEVRLLLLYVESIDDFSALERLGAKAIKQSVPIVVLMGGRSADGKRAAQSHTGALATEQGVVDAFFRRAGIWRVSSMRQFVSATELYLQGWVPQGRNLTVISTSGAICVLAADAAADNGIRMTTFSQEAEQRLRSVLPSFATPSNPVDITAALLSDSSLFGAVLDIVAEDKSTDASLIGIPVAGKGYDVARFARDAATFAHTLRKPLVICTPQVAVAEEFRLAGLVVFEEEGSAVEALAQFLSHHELVKAAEHRGALAPRRERSESPTSTLNEIDSLAVLAAAGIPVIEHVLCSTVDEAERAFERLNGGSAVLKGCTSDATHKSELGLVKLGLNSVDEVRAAAANVLTAMGSHDLTVDGLLVEPMVSSVREVLLGAHRDPTFGPVVVVGSGGKYVEAVPDFALLLPPFAIDDALEAISSLRMAPLFAGVRGEPAADVTAWASAAVTLGEAMIGDESIDSLDANPVLLMKEGLGALVVDAVVVRRPQ